MRLSLGAFLIIGLPIGLASAAEFHKVATSNVPPPVGVGTPVKFKRNVVACHSLDVRLQYFFDRGDPRELSGHHGTNIPEGQLTTVRKFSEDHGVYCMSVPGWKDCGWVLEEPQGNEIVVTPPPADIPQAADKGARANSRPQAKNILPARR
jgi:hypothetical protein